MPNVPSVSIEFTLDEVWALSRAISAEVAFILRRDGLKGATGETKELLDLLVDKVAPKINEASNKMIRKTLE